MLAVLCPGQGSQSPGFLEPWLEFPATRSSLAALSVAAGFDLERAGVDRDADVVDTAVAQPLIAAAGLVSAGLLEPLPDELVVVGHSIGEITAAAIAGVFENRQALALAASRGRAMAEAAAAEPSGMVAVLGGDADAVAAAIARNGCWVANHNAAGQVVAAGALAGLQRLATDLSSGARLRPLPVAGAFHTPLMSAAQAPFAAAVRALPIRDPALTLLSNADGSTVASGAEVVERLVAQIVAPVRFDRCLDTLRALGVTATIELAPAGVLTALVRRALPGVHAIALRSLADVDAARALFASATSGSPTWSEPWRLVVSPARGTFRIGPGRLGTVRSRAGDVLVAGPAPGRVLEWLVEDGDPITTGQPVARVLPEMAE
ncbi:MAG TPA: acyltransferase domain-containing protein [Mycobacteriales bacterium]|nr:acyltransferase domain-containing protein [Mycobacteriales bacterium]